MKTTGDCPDHVLPEGPVLGEDVNEGEGHREGAEEDVRDRHVGDEDVPSGDHFLGEKNGEGFKNTLRTGLLTTQMIHSEQINSLFYSKC